MYLTVGWLRQITCKDVSRYDAMEINTYLFCAENDSHGLLVMTDHSMRTSIGGLKSASYGVITQENMSIYCKFLENQRRKFCVA